MEEMTSKEFDLMIDLMLELLKDGKTEKVIELLENKELYKEKCAEAKKWSSQWAMSSLAPKLLGFYEKAITEYKKKEKNQNDS